MNTNTPTKMPIYMDYSATTPVDPRVADKMIPYITEHFGNPASRSHPYGWEAEDAVVDVRRLRRGFDFLAGGVWAAIHGRWVLVAFIVVGLAYAVWAIRASLRGRTTDTGRLDIGQPTDERDRLLLDRALAAVGLAALAFECGLFLYGVGGPDPASGADSGLRFAGLCLVWIIANRVVVRRDATRA